VVPICPKNVLDFGHEKRWFRPENVRGFVAKAQTGNATPAHVPANAPSAAGIKSQRFFV
jgi:hypothetical protein